MMDQDVAEIGVGASFENTQESHSIALNKAMKSPDKDKFG